jgi:hypothetical protein
MYKAGDEVFAVAVMPVTVTNVIVLVDGPGVPRLSTTLTVTGLVLTTVGVPATTPLPTKSCSPVGNVPDMDHVYGGKPPDNTLSGRTKDPGSDDTGVPTSYVNVLLV